MEVRLKPLIKGSLSFAIPSLRSTRQVGVERAGPDYCYSIFLRHFSHVAPITGGKVPKNVAEFGPGSSIGVGLAALLAGAETYTGLDVVDSTDDALNLAMFDGLVALFQARKSIPREGESAAIFTAPVDWDFPGALVPNLESSLNADRLRRIRADIVAKSGAFIRLAAPWTDPNVLPAQSVDWILSQSVLEHVDDLAMLTAASARWLRLDGVMSHEIDYFCHDLTQHWNGHWAVGPHVWKMIRGRRPYLINRIPHSRQMELLRDSGFEIVSEVCDRREHGLPRADFVAPFNRMSESDAATAVAFVVAKRA